MSELILFVGGGGPWIKSPLRRFTPSWTSRVTCDCLLPFVHPLLSQVKAQRANLLTSISGVFYHQTPWSPASPPPRTHHTHRTHRTAPRPPTGELPAATLLARAASRSASRVACGACGAGLCRWVRGSKTVGRVVDAREPVPSPVRDVREAS